MFSLFGPTATCYFRHGGIFFGINVKLGKKFVLPRGVWCELDFILLYIIVNISMLKWLTLFCGVFIV